MHINCLCAQCIMARMWACCVTYKSLCAGKRRHEAGSVEDDEAGPSKKPRTGVSDALSACSAMHSGHEIAVYPCMFSHSSCMQGGHLRQPYTANFTRPVQHGCGTCRPAACRLSGP